MSAKNVLNVADDNGYYSHKLAWFSEQGKIKTHKYASIIGTGQEVQTSLDGGRVDMYESDSNHYVCNESVQNPIAIRDQDYGLSAENRVLVNHGLVKAGLQGKRIRLATALPMRDYYLRDGRKNDDLIRAQSENMKKTVNMVISDDKEPELVAEIIESRVLSEGVAAMIDFLIADDGQEALPLSDIHAPMAALDFGGSTFDVVTMTPELNIIQDSSGTLQRGTLDIKESFKDLLADRLRSEGVAISKVAPWMVEAGFNKGYVRMQVKGGMKNIEVKDILKKAAEPVVGEIKKFVSSKLKDLTGYQFILLVGGGALLCRELFKDWEDKYGLIVRDEFANARGMLKYMTWVKPTN